jgi:ribose-phosphate pyrophosphokinase
MENKLKVFSGSANRNLALQICEYLKIPLGDIQIGRFPDGEISVKINENVRGVDVFIIQPTSHPVNENIMELLLMIDAFRRASARRITAVISYYGYARQDRKDQPRVAISAKLVANLLTSAGVDRILTMDLHVGQIQGFFDIPVDHLEAKPVLIKYFAEKKIEDLVVASVDVGRAKMAREFAEYLKAPFAILNKHRYGPSTVETVGVIGEVYQKNILIPDDIISTASSLYEAAMFLKNKGAKKIYACCTHPVLCGSAIKKIEDAPIEEVVVTNTISTENINSSKIKVLSVAPLFAEAIKSIHNETSISKLFEIKL